MHALGELCIGWLLLVMLVMTGFHENTVGANAVMHRIDLLLFAVCVGRRRHRSAANIPPMFLLMLRVGTFFVSGACVLCLICGG
jgi:hypothetical protein